MTYAEYQRKRTWLIEVLRDAEERGDYHLEMDTREMISELDHDYHEGEEE